VDGFLRVYAEEEVNSPHVGDLARLDVLERRPLTIGAGSVARLVHAGVRFRGYERPTGETHHQVHQAVTDVARSDVEDVAFRTTPLVASPKSRLGMETVATVGV
jgi:hypothetical protein